MNKQKKEKATNEVEGILELYPEYATQLTSSGDETSDKKNQNTLDKLKKGELGLSGLEGLLGKFALMERKDAKELAEANAQRQIISDQLNQDLLKENLTGKKLSNKANLALEEFKTGAREKEQNALNQYTSQIHDIEALVASGTKPKDLSGLDQWLYMNRVAILNGQMPAGEMVVPRNFRMTEAQLKQSLEKGQQDLAIGNIDKKIKKVDLESKEADLLGGDYNTWEDAAAKQTEFYEAGFVTTARLNPNGGVDIVDQKPIVDAEEAGEFDEVKDFPGHFVRKGDSHLYRKDDAGNLQQVGAPTSTQEMGQLQAYINSASNKWVDFYINAMNEGKLIQWTSILGRKTHLPQSEWYYELDGEDDVPYNKDHERTALRIKSAQDKMDAYFDLDITR